MTHAASAPFSQADRMSPAAMILALAVHISTFLALWMVSPLRPILPVFDNAIDVTLETPVPEPPPVEAKKDPLAPPVELGLAPREGAPPAPTSPLPPEQPEPRPQSAPETVAPAVAIPVPAPEPPRPPLEQLVPLPEAARPPAPLDFPKPTPPRPPVQALPPARPAPAPPPRPPADNQAALKPSPLHSSIDVTIGNAADYYTQLTRRLGQYRYYPKGALEAQQEGRVVVRILIGRDGRLIDVQVEQSSGWPAIDGAEMDTIRRAAPFPPFPPGMAGETATFRSSVTYNPTVLRRLR